MSSHASTINQRLLELLHHDGDRIFCHLKPFNQQDYVALSYRQLLAGACDYLHTYRAMGLRVGEPIQIILDHGMAMIYAFVGAMLGGFVPSFLAPISDKQDPQHYWTQLKIQSEHIQGGLLVTSSALQQQMATVIDGVPVLCCEQVPQHRGSLTAQEIIHRATPTDIALLQHSSGTTGSRKGVALNHRAILHQIENYAAALKLGQGDVIVSWLPLYHDMGLISSFLMPLVMAAPVVLISPFEWVNQPRLLLDAIQQFRATLAWLPNFAFHFLARLRLTEPLPDLSSLRALINCSEPCKKEAFDALLTQYGAMGVDRSKLQICYAMAETVFAATQTPLNQPVLPLQVARAELLAGRLAPSSGAGASDDVFLMPVGYPVADMQVQILDEQGQALTDGQIGEIALTAPFMFSGYYHNPSLTERAFKGGAYLTGDLGAQWQGALYITGRKKDLIIVNGRNYYAHDIEAIASAVNGVKPGRCVAFGIYNQALGSEGIVVLAESDQGESRQLAVQIKAALQRDMGIIINKAVIVPPRWLIKTTSGKISRKDNKERYMASLADRASKVTSGAD